MRKLVSGVLRWLKPEEDTEESFAGRTGRAVQEPEEPATTATTTKAEEEVLTFDLGKLLANMATFVSDGGFKIADGLLVDNNPGGPDVNDAELKDYLAAVLSSDALREKLFALIDRMKVRPVGAILPARSDVREVKRFYSHAGGLDRVDGKIIATVNHVLVSRDVKLRRQALWACKHVINDTFLTIMKVDNKQGKVTRAELLGTVAGLQAGFDANVAPTLRLLRKVKPIPRGQGHESLDRLRANADEFEKTVGTEETRKGMMDDQLAEIIQKTAGPLDDLIKLATEQRVAVHNLVEDQLGSVRVYAVLNRKDVKFARYPKKGESLYVGAPPLLFRKTLETGRLMDENSKDFPVGSEKKQFFHVYENSVLTDLQQRYRENPNLGLFENLEFPDVALKNLFDQVASGYRVVLFGYGHSGSGKTYTIFGKPGVTRGVVDLGLEYLEKKHGKPMRLDAVFEMSGKTAARANEFKHEFKRPITKGSDWTQVIDKITAERKAKLRIVETPNNPESSRSHLVLNFVFRKVGGKQPSGQLFVLDMAGSEDTAQIVKDSITVSDSDSNEANNFKEALLRQMSNHTLVYPWKEAQKFKFSLFSANPKAVHADPELYKPIVDNATFILFKKRLLDNYQTGTYINTTIRVTMEFFAHRTDRSKTISSFKFIARVGDDKEPNEWISFLKELATPQASTKPTKFVMLYMVNVVKPDQKKAIGEFIATKLT